MLSVNGYEFYLADNSTQLCLTSPIGGVDRIFLDKMDTPLTIRIAEDGTHRVER